MKGFILIYFNTTAYDIGSTIGYTIGYTIGPIVYYQPVVYRACTGWTVVHDLGESFSEEF